MGWIDPEPKRAERLAGEWHDLPEDNRGGLNVQQWLMARFAEEFDADPAIAARFGDLHTFARYRCGEPNPLPADRPARLN